MIVEIDQELIEKLASQIKTQNDLMMCISHDLM